MDAANAIAGRFGCPNDVRAEDWGIFLRRPAREFVARWSRWSSSVVASVTMMRLMVGRSKYVHGCAVVTDWICVLSTACAVGFWRGEVV